MISSGYQYYLDTGAQYDTALRRLADKEAARNPRNHAVVACDAGSVWLEVLPWDTRVLGVPCARVHALFADADNWTVEAARDLAALAAQESEARGAAFLSCRVRAGVPSLLDGLTASGWLQRDALNVYTLGASRPAAVGPPAGVEIIGLPASQLQGRYDDFATEFRYGRIHREPMIPDGRAVAFYRALFEGIVAEPAALRLGLLTGGELVGFAIGAADQALESTLGVTFTYLWQIGVRPDFRGGTHAMALLEGFLARVPKDHVLEVETQFDNVAANRLYTRAGLLLAGNAFTYHRWSGSR
jgi:ribosomal protein S18 acetylase RimI-like enzyme